MRIHIFSDLHLEFGPLECSPEVRSGALAELVLLAGDVHTKRRGPRWAATMFSQPVVMVGGNHEAYGDSLYAAIAGNRQSAAISSAGRPKPVEFLERETWITQATDGTPVRVIGATLWTDFEALGLDQRSRVMEQARQEINDFAAIEILDSQRHESRQLEPLDLLRIHEQSRQFIVHELSCAFDGLTIVLTHHAPSLKSVSQEYSNDPLTAAYASALELLIEQFQPDLWAHGHIHTSSDYTIGATRIVCNPRGYAPSELNPRFDPKLTVEINR